MKVLQVNVVYQKGSTGKIMFDIHQELLKEGLDSVVCYGRGKVINEQYVYKTSTEVLAKFNALRARITGLQYNGSFLATNKLISIINHETPDVIHLHCLNGYFVNIYRLIDYLKQNNIKTILTLHAEFMYTGSCGHALDCIRWKNIKGCNNCPIVRDATKSFFFDRTQTAWELMRKSFEDFDNLTIVSVSPWLMKRAMDSTILSGKKHITVLNGIDTSKVFKPCDFSQLKEKHKLNDEKILLHVTANFKSEIKGGKYIQELAKRLINENIKIIVIGNEHNMDLPSNVIDVGRVYDQKVLAAYYSLADLTILTSKRETFSMICAESLSCGTPVVGFKAGAPEEISISDFSEFVEYGDMEQLERSINVWLNRKTESNKIISEIASEKYSKENMAIDYINLYKAL
ncbi:MAG: hypothetical protein FD141_86 [Fusobacteria bacterium]|nr:MAG: hypothetical protein FD141_86 [Fusobacteriota bacterium]KAF0229250.1 MAG: hypothetical protein FD182_1506 [Fusobacteriota bacterium]